MKNLKLNSNKLEMNLQRFAGESGFSSQGAKLSYKKGSTFTEALGVKSMPALGSEPEKLDVTTLASKRKNYIEGIGDTDNLEFTFVYTKENYSALDALVKENKEVDWKIEWPGGIESTFKGKPSLKFNGLEVNQVVEFVLVVVVSDGPDTAVAP